jgi:hypothetical protein
MGLPDVKTRPGYIAMEPALGSEGRLLFVNKKKQKTLLCWVMGNVADDAHAPA